MTLILIWETSTKTTASRMAAQPGTSSPSDRTNCVIGSSAVVSPTAASTYTASRPPHSCLTAPRITHPGPAASTADHQRNFPVSLIGGMKRR